MADVQTQNLAMGPGKLYVATFGATEPADSALASDPSDAVWRFVGATTGGATLTIVKQFKEFEIDQLVETTGRVLTQREVSLKTQLAEATLENLALAASGGTITPGSGYSTFSLGSANAGGEPDYSAILFDSVVGGGRRRRTIIRKVLATDNVDTAASKDGMVVYPVTFVSHYVSSSIDSVKIIEEDEDES